MNNNIGDRINAALALKHIKQKELAKELGVKDNVVSYWCSGNRTPNTQQIIQIAKTLNVSTDYLLGLSNVATADIEIKSICDYTGLDEKAVNALKERKDRIVRKNYYSDFDNYLFYTDNEELLFFYLNLMNEAVNKFISSDCFEDIIKLLVSETLLSLGLEFTEYICSGNVKNNEFNKMNSFEICHCLESLIIQNRDIQKKHRLNLFDLQDYITDFCKKISNVDNYELFGDVQYKTTLIERFLYNLKNNEELSNDFINKLNEYMKQMSNNNEQ